MAEGKMFHLRLHQTDALEWLQDWFRQKREAEMMRPVGNPPASLIVDVCLQREAELKASAGAIVRLPIEAIEAEAKELAMRLFERNFARLLNELGHPAVEVYRTENGQGLAAKIGPYIGDTTERDQIMELVNSAVDFDEVRGEVID